MLSLCKEHFLNIFIKIEFFKIFFLKFDTNFDKKLIKNVKNTIFKVKKNCKFL